MDRSYYTTIGVILALLIAVATITTSYQKAWAPPASAAIFQRKAAPMATSDDNVYVSWPSNKTVNDEVMFKVSTDVVKHLAIR